jgi:HSP20 family protein
MSSTALETSDVSRQAIRLHGAMDRLIQSFFAPLESLIAAEGPLLAIDLDESTDAYTLRASLPGVKPDNVQVEIHDATVLIHGEIEEEQLPTTNDKKYRSLLHERYYGIMQRVITLPTSVDETKATATFDHGVLTLTLPKTEQTKSLRIPIKTTA